MDLFYPNLVLVNTNKLKPYQFLDDEAQTIDDPWRIYWEGQGDANVNDKEEDNNEKLVYMVQINQIASKTNTMKVDTFFVRVDVHDICLDPMLDGNIKHKHFK